MATAVEEHHNLPSQSIQDAIRDLVKSFGVHGLEDAGPSITRCTELKQACEELGTLPFHSDEGRLFVIRELAKLRGNYVVKIVRQGLCSLSKVYQPQTFENEVTELVKLCCLQYSMQTGSEGDDQVASPSSVIEWTVELCDELMRPSSSDEYNSSIDGLPLVKCLVKLSDICKSITAGRMKVLEGSGLDMKMIDPFKSIFEALKTRIRLQGFEELIDQTAAIVKREGENLDVMNFSSTGAPKLAVLLYHWISLLKFPFVTNWFAFNIAKHDFLVHDREYAQNLPFSDQRTYLESLIVQVVESFSFLTGSSSEPYKFACDKSKAQVFFDNSEVLLRHTLPCLQLMESDVGSNLIKEIFLLLQIKLNRDLLPGITDSDKKQCQPLLDAFQKTIVSPDHMGLQAMMEAANAKLIYDMKTLNHISTSRSHQTASFNAITRALVTLPDKQQVLKILQIWKRNFPDDTSYLMLSELFVLVEVIIQKKVESVSSEMEKFIAFLLQLHPTFFSTLRIWRPLFEYLLVLLPQTYHCPQVLSLITVFVDLHVRQTLKSGQNIDKTFVQKILQNLDFLRDQAILQNSKSEEVEIKTLKLALEVFEEIPHPDEYEFALNVIHSVASDMDNDSIKTFTLSLLKTARLHITRIQYPEIWQVLLLIDHSRSIRCKTEVYESFLKVLQNTTSDDVKSTVNICSDFLKLFDSINAENTKSFFALAAKRKMSTCQFVLECLFFNQRNISRDRVNENIAFLLAIVEKILSSDRRNCELFFKTIHDYLELQLLAYSVDTFEMFVALIAGSIAMGTFDRDLNDVVLRVLLVAVHSRKLDNQAVILIIYFYLSQTLRQVRAGKGRRYMESFGDGVHLIMRLPLKLQQTKWIIQKVIAIFDQEITDEQEAWSVMCHLFKMGDGSCAIDPADLESHFTKVLEPSVIRNTAKVLLLFRHKEVMLSTGDKETPLSSLFSLSDLLVERMPSTFANKTSAELFKFIVKRVEKNMTISAFILPVVEATIKENSSEYKLKTEIKEIEETFLHVHDPQLVPFISECLRQYYLLDASEKKNIKVFILQILECLRNSQLNFEDIFHMIESVLNVPKQLVLVFQRAANGSEALRGMARVFDVTANVDRVIFNGKFLLQFEKEDHERLTELVQHDFFMALRETSLMVSDACTVMEFYRHLNPEDLVTILALSRKLDVKAKQGDNNAFWLSKYTQDASLTPGNLVYLVLVHLQKIRIPKPEVSEKALAICSQLLANYALDRQVPCQCLLKTTFLEYVESFFLVIDQCSSISDIEHWLTFLPHHAVQSKSVIIAACSWRAKSECREEIGRMIDNVSKALLKLAAPTTSGMPSLCYAGFTREIEVMTLALTTAKDEEVANKLLNLILTNRGLTEACIGVVRSWNKKESLVFIEEMKQLCEQRNKSLKEGHVDSEIAIPLQILPFAAKPFPNATTKVVELFRTISEKGGGPEDPLSLGRLPVWYKQMTDAGYAPQVIESWCTSLVHSTNLCSSEVDAITNLNPELMKILNKDSDEVGRCLFSREAPKTWKSEGETDDEYRISLDTFKHCLHFTRLLNELASISGCLQENPKVVQLVKECTTTLCSNFMDEECLSGNLYKVRYCLLKELFVLLFGEDKGAEEAGPTNMEDIMAHEALTRSLVTLFRRLARSFASRPTLLGIVKSIVSAIQKRVTESRLRRCQEEVQGVIHEAIQSLESTQDASRTLQDLRAIQNQAMDSPQMQVEIRDVIHQIMQSLKSNQNTTQKLQALRTIQKQVVENHQKQCQEEVQDTIHQTILGLQSNQDTMQTLQVSGYNQCATPNEDLWFSSSIQMPAYIAVGAFDESLQLERSLRQLWIEWRDVLLVNKISEITLDEEKVKTTELFKPSDSLETMESHLLSVKQATKSLSHDNWSSYRRRHLIRNERQLRTSIKEQKEQVSFLILI